MGTQKPENSNKRELDDSGCVQDGSPPSKKPVPHSVGLLDLSDDVLLLILQYCGAQDLKALGFTCPRLGSLIQDRTLWTRVDARDAPSGRARLKWMIQHGIHSGTKELMVMGYARETQGCQGHSWRRDIPNEHERSGNRCCAPGNVHAQITMRYSTDPFLRMQAEQSNNRYLLWYDGPSEDFSGPSSNVSGPSVKGQDTSGPSSKSQDANGASSDLSCSSVKVEDESGVSEEADASGPPADNSGPSVKGQAANCPLVKIPECPGPQFTLSASLMSALRDNCNLTSLSLEYCNIDCSVSKMSQFPRGLRRLSLRGTRCFNARVQESLITKINDYLCNLEEIDLSECAWVFPSEMMPLSRLPCLKKLHLAACPRLTEFVAYSSLATRFGFKKLQYLDLSRSGVSDSEASGLGWLPLLEELYLSPVTAEALRGRDGTHTHPRGEAWAGFSELDDWEKQVPEYFQTSEVEESKEKETESSKQNQANSGSTSSQPLVDHVAIMSHSTPNSPGPSFSIMIKRKINVVDDTENVTAKKQRTEQSNEEAGTSNGNQNKERKTDVKSDGNDVKTDGNNVKTEGNDVNADGKDVKADGSDVKTDGNDVKADSSDVKTDSNDVNADGKDVKADGSDVKTDSSDVNADSSDVNADGNDDTDSDSHSDCGCVPDNYYDDYVQFMESDLLRHLDDRVPGANGANDQNDEEMPEGNEQANQNAQIAQNEPDYRENRVIIISNRNANGTRNEPEVVVCGRPYLEALDRIYTYPEPSTLITDSTILNYGYADGTVINYVYVGPVNGDNNEGVRRTEGRPQHSNLRVLSVTGYSNITNRSLVHLATAAPRLVRLDLTRTNVTEIGVERFKALRPDCEVIFSKFDGKK